MSFSYTALILAIKDDDMPMIISVVCTTVEDKNTRLNRYKMKIPAVTRVEECTRGDSGVGAAIAAGSHLENGIWALFVAAASIILKHCMVRYLLFIIL